ncbi:MAG TPA: DUF3228 family protein [Myxococcales bacterium LLY-WYZ-16_1]|nr:DUF3228 family protein [Myxococcales bacterium LLY-WYZ-16_1]
MSDAAVSLGWSEFALKRHQDPSRRVFEGTPEELLDLVRTHWASRTPGYGRDGLDQVVVVGVPPDRFVSTTVRVGDDTPLVAEFAPREPEEDPVIQVFAEGPPEPARFAQVVLYSAATLLENGGRRSTGADWEVVALRVVADPDEPMHPVTMARNFLGKVGGTPAPYTAEQFAEAIWYWSSRAKRHVPSSE